MCYTIANYEKKSQSLHEFKLNHQSSQYIWNVHKIDS